VSEVYEFYTDEDIQVSNDMARQRNFVEWVELNGQGSERGRPKPVRRTSPGYVYLIKGNGVYKIGRSKKLDQRLTYFELKLPFPIEMVHTIYSNDYAGLERKLHDLYNSKRINGEWFELALEDVEYIKSIRSDSEESP
jgi:hypothetical protein